MTEKLFSLFTNVNPTLLSHELKEFKTLPLSNFFNEQSNENEQRIEKKRFGRRSYGRNIPKNKNSKRNDDD